MSTTVIELQRVSVHGHDGESTVLARSIAVPAATPLEVCGSALGWSFFNGLVLPHECDNNFITNRRVVHRLML